MIPAEFIEGLLKKIDIADLAADYVDLIPNGAQLKGICPFCRSNAFTVSVDKQIWKCFKCSKGGKSRANTETLMCRMYANE